jgi:hypothetical protein
MFHLKTETIQAPKRCVLNKRQDVAVSIDDSVKLESSRIQVTVRSVTVTFRSVMSVLCTTLISVTVFLDEE